MAWQFVGVSSIVTDTSGAMTLTLPANTQSGDLLVACIAYRSNAPFSPASGWNEIAQQSGGDTDTADGISSCFMAYIVRGGSSPSLDFSRTSGDVAMGVIVAYRNTDLDPDDVLDTWSINLMASSGTAVNTGSLTTSRDGDLIVCLAAGGDSRTFDTFDAATDPSTGSGGSTDTSTNPTNGTWLRRATDSTTSGADAGIGVADAVRATAGSTGTISAVANGNGRHSMIAAAFKVVPADPEGKVTFKTPTTGTNWEVPTGVTEITVKTWGGGGGGGSGASTTAANGAGAGYATAVLSTTPGETLVIRVAGGGGGANTRCGGGGGGYSGIFRSGSPLIIAGGGGGGAGTSSGTTLGHGGPGGGSSGTAGDNGGHTGGGGGTQVAGGTGGANGSSGGGSNGGSLSGGAGGLGGGGTFGQAGTAGAGGTNGGASGGRNSSTGSYSGGGGGGGGYFGGGGGRGAFSSQTASGGGGGGGSSFLSGSSTSTSSGSGQNPGNNGDSDYLSVHNINGKIIGRGGDGSLAPTVAESGGGGLIIITWEPGEEKEADAALDAEGTVANVNFVVLRGRSADLSADGTITSSAERFSLRSASLSASGALGDTDFVTVRSAVAALSADADVDTVGERWRHRSSSISAAASVAASAERHRLRSAHLSAVATCSASAERHRLVSTSLNATASITAEATNGVIVQIFAESFLTALGEAHRPAFVALDAQASLASQAVGLFVRASSLSAAASVSVAGELSKEKNGFAPLSASSDIQASANAFRPSAASVTVDSALDADAVAVRSVAAELDAAAVVTVVGELFRIEADASISAFGAVFSFGERFGNAQAELDSNSVLSSSADRHRNRQSSNVATFTLNATAIRQVFRKADLTATSTAFAFANRLDDVVSLLRVNAEFKASYVLVRSIAASLVGLANISASASNLESTSAQLSAHATVFVSASRLDSVSASLASAATCAASADRHSLRSAILAAVADVNAVQWAVRGPTKTRLRGKAFISVSVNVAFGRAAILSSLASLSCNVFTARSVSTSLTSLAAVSSSRSAIRAAASQVFSDAKIFAKTKVGITKGGSASISASSRIDAGWGQEIDLANFALSTKKISVKHKSLVRSSHEIIATNASARHVVAQTSYNVTTVAPRVRYIE